MIPELGQVALILALQLAVLQAFLGLAGAAREDHRQIAMARGAACGQAVFVLAGFLALMSAFAANDFSVQNVAEHSTKTLPLAYRLTAVWGSHEGSFLLWTLLMAAWTLAVVYFSRALPTALAARVIGVMGGLSACFLAFILFASNPFLRLHPPPADGSDLNPLLQDPGMIIHPPLLYMGYVGFSVAFAFAIAALLSGRLDQQWAGWVRPWTVTAWSFLTMGIAIGAWWAYYELGWGGWWFWDPSENASLMPWLMGTALVHSLMATEQRNSLRVWTVFLAIATFSLSLLGTFLVRSGVLASVHAFAQDPLRGMFILILMCALIGSSLLLFAWRASTLKAEPRFALVSRESGVLLANVLLLVALGTVMLGTFYPLILDAFGLGKISVGPPYFNAVFIPVMTPLLLLLGIGPWLPWGRARLSEHRRTLVSLFAAAALVGLVVPGAMAEFRWQAALGISISVWILLSTGLALIRRCRAESRLSRRALGMSLAHIGLAIGVAGMGLVGAYESSTTMPMHLGDRTTLHGTEFVFQGADEVPAENYSAMRARIDLVSAGQAYATLHPEKRLYRVSRNIMTESAIRSSWDGDIYVALGDPLPGGGWTVQVYRKPFVGWLWLGAAIMALGGLVAAASRRRSDTSTEEKAV